MRDSLLVKLMMLTTSTNDAEALAALRKANKILKDAKVNWAELLGAAKPDQSFRVPPSRRPRPEPSWDSFGDDQRYTNEDEINRMFDKVFNSNMSEGFAEFVESVHLWWEQHGWLSVAQYRAIKKAAER